MTREEFIEQYCTLCGTQRCYGEEYCGKYQQEVLKKIEYSHEDSNLSVRQKNQEKTSKRGRFTDEQIIACLNQCEGTSFLVADLVDNGKSEKVSLARIIEILNNQQTIIETLQDNNEHLAVLLNEAKAEATKEVLDLVPPSMIAESVRFDSPYGIYHSLASVHSIEEATELSQKYEKLCKLREQIFGSPTK